jgi:hypothetical protein
LQWRQGLGAPSSGRAWRPGGPGRPPVRHSPSGRRGPEAAERRPWPALGSSDLPCSMCNKDTTSQTPLMMQERASLLVAKHRRN